MRTHVVPVPVQVALAAVAAGEGHTVGVNVQLTHWGAGRVKGLSPLPTAPPPSLGRLYQARPPQVLDTLPLPFLSCGAGAPTSQTRGARFSSLPAWPPAPASLGGQLENPQTCPPIGAPPSPTPAQPPGHSEVWGTLGSRDQDPGEGRRPEGSLVGSAVPSQRSAGASRALRHTEQNLRL